MTQVAMPWAGLKQELEKKTTFESACAKTISILTEDPARTADAGLRALLRRVRTLLRSRHSSPAFWHKGRQLFHAAEGLTADAGLRAELAEFVAECDAFLGAHSTSSDAAAGEQAGQQWEGQQQGRSGSAQPFLFEGQISAESPPRPAGLLDAILHIAARVQQQQQQHQEQQQQQQQQEHQEQEGREGQHTVGGSGQGQGDDPSAAAAATGLPGLTPEMMETMQQELDAIAVELMEESGQQVPRPAPPASKRVLRQLPREALTPERLEELGGPGVRCPVCMEEYTVGSEVQVLPCKHTYHEPCLAPWMASNNSCPTCRLELPTDDVEYERRKERETEEAQTRAGQVNATSALEFMYL